MSETRLNDVLNIIIAYSNIDTDVQIALASPMAEGLARAAYQRLDDLFDTARHCAVLRPWHLFREPALATAVHGLACLTAALNRARERA